MLDRDRIEGERNETKEKTRIERQKKREEIMRKRERENEKKWGK